MILSQTIYELGLDIMPDTTMAALTFIGVYMCLPTRAKAIEDNHLIRKGMLYTCLILGVVGVISNHYQRAEAGAAMNELRYVAGNQSKSIDYIKGVLPRPSSHISLPEVKLSFVYPDDPALLLINTSNAIAKEIKWEVALWDLNTPDRTNPLPIPASTFDFIRPHQRGGPQNLFDSPNVLPLLKNGDRLFGSASVVCPDCVRGHTYWVYIVWHEGGWYAETPGLKNGELMTPKNFLQFKPTLEGILKTIPNNAKVAIKQEY